MPEFQLIEALDVKPGEVPERFRVRVMRAGLSQNGNYYPLEVLHEAAPLFEGIRARAIPDDVHLQAGSGKDPMRVAGWFTQPVPSPDGIDATFIAESEPVRKKFWFALNHDKKDYLGFSAVVSAVGNLRRTADGVRRDVKKITKAHFVDVIVDPSAGGEIVGLAEARGTHAGRHGMLEKLLKLIEARAPEQYKTLDLENLDENKIFEIAEALMAKPKDAPADKPAPPAAKVDNEAIKVLLAEAQADAHKGILEEIAAHKAELLFERLLAESKLPDDAHERVRAALPDDKPWTKELIAEAIAGERTYLARHTQFRGPGSAAIEVGLDETDRWGAAMDAFFIGEAQEAGPKKTKIAPFKSIRHAVAQFAVINGLGNAGMDEVTLCEATITSSTFSGAMGDYMHKALQREYKMAPYNEWRAIADVVRVNDFRNNYRAQLGGFSGLAGISEAESYLDNTFTTEPDDFTPYYAVTKYGATQLLTLETIVNDDVGAVQRMPRKMARAAARDLNTAVWAPIVNNSNVTWTATALASSTFANYTTSALSPAAIEAGRLAMMKQAEPQSSERLNIPPRYLAVPQDLAKTAFELCYSAAKPLLATNAQEGGSSENENIPNFFRTFNLEPIVIPHATDANNWWLLADKADVQILEVGFLGGKEEPELFVQDMPNVGTMFTHDYITYKVRHIYGVVVLDYRGVYGGIVA